MLRLTELKLPLDHAEDEIEAAVLKRLRLKPQDLIGYSVFRRAVDARKKSAIALIYTLDVEVKNEAALLKRLARRPQCLRWPPTTGYRFKARAPAARGIAAGRHRHRPLRSACGAGAGADGLPPDHPRARQGRARAHEGHLGPLAQVGAQSGIERAVRRRRRRHVLRRQALQPDQGPASLRPQGADRIRQGRRAGRDPLRRQAAHRHVPAGDDRGKIRATDRSARRRVSLPEQGRRPRYRCAGGRQPAGARRGAGRRHAILRPITSCWRSATARATRSRCCTSAASRSRPSRSPSACASSTRSR